MLKKIRSVWEQRGDLIVASIIGAVILLHSTFNKIREYGLLMISCGILYSIGGGGWKTSRRFLMSIMVAGYIFRKISIKTILLISSLSLVLSLGYDDMTQQRNWPMIVALGATYGLSWVPVLKKEVWRSIVLMIFAWLVAMTVSYYTGIKWGISEYIIGACYGIIAVWARKLILKGKI